MCFNLLFSIRLTKNHRIPLTGRASIPTSNTLPPAFDLIQFLVKTHQQTINFIQIIVPN